jgi:transcriptional regulator of acetoin/glycerol metabolism
MTGTMEGRAGRPRAPAPEGAGLVLLYAPNHADLASVVKLGDDAVVLGREPPAGGFAIPQIAVSRVHARVARQGDAWTVTDLDSRNGVLVNGCFVDERTLAPGDELRVGDAIFKLVVSDIAAYARFRVADPGVALASGVGGPLVAKLALEIERVAPTDISILVVGETGTGKELTARAIHDASARRGQLCALNCAAIPASLVESELFGFRRGAFTGADRDHPGLVRTAHGGTLLLDEIGDMPLEAQAKLLRMLETREVVPLGAARGERVDVRVVCATNRDLRALVDAGRFRGDLFARIQGYTLTLPPLRARKEDIYRLVRHFLAAAGRAEVGVTFPFMVAACHYGWPYNVRELEGAVRRALAVADGPLLDEAHLPEVVAAAMKDYAATRGEAPSEPPALRAVAPSGTPGADELRELLRRHAGNVAAVARELGKDRTQIHRWMRLHAIRPDDFR